MRNAGGSAVFVPVDPKGHIAVHQTDRMVVGVRLRRYRLICLEHGYSTREWVETGSQGSPWRWRALDLRVWKAIVTARLRRLGCPSHRRIVGAVQLVLHRAPSFTCESQALVGWLGVKADACAVSRLTPSRRPDRGPAGAVQWPRLQVPVRPSRCTLLRPHQPVAPPTRSDHKPYANALKTQEQLTETCLPGGPDDEFAHTPVPTRFRTWPQ